ncbi:molybdopterin-synthase adenylyltransferase MoeB [Flavobacterium sp. LC2016-23]|uniref:HesA/MoeB/ThiF family protein n=1 Tax=Flavobacterium sp. LC2016-23 TaxID=2666330 RepID=UPI0012AFD4D3|nr:HesA/MoeB/ThiF family protein [Flavobacterium sp. LC2016-23]MRX41881.1 molybdopterin-synthase adenylyltransferase MoeB [Flavobacterium sp. LC2016-23]
MNASMRYNRQIILPEIGEKGQEKLAGAKVLVIGAGGLGTAVLPYLAAAGVGEIGIADHDVIEISNLQRQVIYKTAAVGKYKTDEAKLMLAELNPSVKVNSIAEQLAAHNAISLFENYDIIVDATDNLAVKYLINDACLITNKPMVYGSVFRFEGQVSVFNYQNGPTYRCLFPEENSLTANCNDAGVVGISVGIIGLLQAGEVLKMILGTGEILSGKLLVYSILSNEQQKYDFEKNTDVQIDRIRFEEKYNLTDQENNEMDAEMVLNQIDGEEVLFLDVRNKYELPEITMKNSIQIPLMQLEKELENVDRDKTIYIFCQSGIRSKKAVEILLKNNFKKVKSISGGALVLSQLLKDRVEI